MSELLNQRGFLEAPAFVLLLVLAGLMGSQAWVWRVRLEQVREHHRQVLCLKRAINTTTSLVRQVGGVNRMLSAGRVAQGLALLFPGSGWLMALKWEKAKKALMALQEAAWLKAQHSLLSERARGCRLPMWAQLTPYQHRMGLVRQGDVAQLRRSSELWRLPTPLMSFVSRWSLESPLDTRISWEVR